MNNGDTLILSNKLEYKPGSCPEPVVERVLTIKEIEARIDTVGRDIEPITFPYFYDKATTKDKDKDSEALNNLFMLQSINYMQSLANKAWAEFSNHDQDTILTKERVKSYIESFEKDIEVKETKFLIRVLKSRSKWITIKSGNLTVYWNKTVRKRINLIKTKKTKHGKSKLIKFKTTVRSRDNEPIGEITF